MMIASTVGIVIALIIEQAYLALGSLYQVDLATIALLVFAAGAITTAANLLNRLMPQTNPTIAHERHFG
jgi:hypothetical protein